MTRVVVELAALRKSKDRAAYIEAAWAYHGFEPKFFYRVEVHEKHIVYIQGADFIDKGALSVVHFGIGRRSFPHGGV